MIEDRQSCVGRMFRKSGVPWSRSTPVCSAPCLVAECQLGILLAIGQQSVGRSQKVEPAWAKKSKVDWLGPAWCQAWPGLVPGSGSEGSGNSELGLAQAQT